jgi:3-methylcrotonyl-CoA carboxylase alpha subunit
VKVLSGGQEYRTQVRSSRESVTVDVDDETFTLDLQVLSPGTFSLRRDTGVETFHCVREGPTIHLFWRGRTYLLEEIDEDSPSGHRHSSGGLEAPMPGKVIAVRVAPGDRVAKGAEVLVVEAMKMENALRAPRDGLVKAVRVKVGDTVTPGLVLVEIE